MLDGRLRVSVNQGLAPVGRGLRRIGVTPDVLTASGLVISAITAWLIAIGEFRWAVLGITLSGLVDLLDGSVARTSGLASPRGSFFDSVADRVSDALVLGGCAWYLAGEGGHLAMLPLAALGLSMLISYERAKAEAMQALKNTRNCILGCGINHRNVPLLDNQMNRIKFIPHIARVQCKNSIAKIPHLRRRLAGRLMLMKRISGRHKK